MMSQNEIRQKHPKGTNPAHIKRMKFHMDHGVNFSTAHNMAEAEGFKAKGKSKKTKKGLSGISIHPEYVFAYENWAAETKQRRKTDVTPRSFEEYTKDPNGDGYYTDSLTDQDWWDQKARPGYDAEYAAMTAEMSRIRNGEPSYWWTRITQPQFVRTTAEDYMPDWMNVFTKEDGSRVHSYDIVKGNDSKDVLGRGVVGAGISLGNIVFGGAVGYGFLFLIMKLAKSNADDLIEVPFKLGEGLIDGAAGLVGSVLSAPGKIAAPIKKQYQKP
jgi:hypothetical protein